MASKEKKKREILSNGKVVYDLSKMTQDEVFGLLDSVSDTTYVEDDVSEDDFDDEQEFNLPKDNIYENTDMMYLPCDKQSQATYFSASDISATAARHPRTNTATTVQLTPKPSTSAITVLEEQPEALSSVENGSSNLQESTLKTLSSTFTPRRKRPRSPLPEFEEGTDISTPNGGGFTGDVMHLTAHSKECKGILWRKRNLQLHKNDVVFRGNTKLPGSFMDLKTPYQCFSYFFTKELLDQIAGQTNLYARQADIKTFTVSSTDIRKYIGILIFMSIYRYPNAAEYWGRYSFEPIRLAMPSKRFYMIRKYLHFNDNSKQIKRGEPGFDPLYKIRPLVQHFNTRFETVPKLPRLCVDEQMCSTKMNAPLRQYMPAKPHKWGFKLFVLCDSNGYSYSFEVFTGAGSNIILPDMPDLSPAANVVVRLSQTIPNFVNHIVYFDNFYTTLPLLIYLRSRGIYALGTIRSGRIPNCKLPGDKDKDLIKADKGFSVEYSGNAHGVDLTTVLWKDNKNVRLASTYVGVLPFKCIQNEGQQLKVTRFNQATRKYMEIDCPNIIREYNYHIGGVGLMDELLRRYHIRLKTRKWTLRLFYHLIDVAMVNSYLLFKRIHNDSPTLPAFRAQVAAVLCANENIKKEPGKPTLTSQQETVDQRKPTSRTYIPEPDIRFDGLNHMPDILDRSGKRMCKNKGCKKETQVFCNKCNLNLCLSSTQKCFQEFHTK